MSKVLPLVLGSETAHKATMAARLHRRGQVPALRLAELSELAVTLLAGGPQTQIYVGRPDGGPPELLDPASFQARREELRTMIRADLGRTVARDQR
jgi:hypothetical protein